MSAHTPTPWRWEGNTLLPVECDPSVSAVYSILDADGGYGFLGSDVKATARELETDRAFIVLAVNSHDELVAALVLAVRAMRAPLDDWKGELERLALNAASAALAKVCS